MKKQILFGTLLVAATLWACNSNDSIDNPMGSSPLLVSPAPTGTQQSPTVPEPTATPTEEETIGCEVITVNRARIKIETSCTKGVRFFVPASVTLGTGYYNIWLPATNAGRKLGPFSYGEWSEWTAMVAGSYKYRLAAETKTDSGKVYQCDRHSGSFTIPECKTECNPCPEHSFNPKKTESGIVIPSAPNGMYYTINGQGYYHDAQTYQAPKLQCEVIFTAKIELFDEHCPGKPVECDEMFFKFKGPECPIECEWSANPGCYKSQKSWGNPRKECAKFGLLPLFKKELSGNQSKVNAHRNADVAIVKAGNYYNVYVNVLKGQQLSSCDKGTASFLVDLTMGEPMFCNKDISHVTYCVCELPD